MASIIGMK